MHCNAQETLLLKLKYICLFFPEDLLCIAEDSNKLINCWSSSYLKNVHYRKHCKNVISNLTDKKKKTLVYIKLSIA